MAIGLTKLRSLLKKGELESLFLERVIAETGESFSLREEVNGSSVAYANLTRKYLGSKGSKIVTSVDARKNTVHGVTTTAEAL